jgi:hypothetical protein
VVILAEWQNWTVWNGAVLTHCASDFGNRKSIEPEIRQPWPGIPPGPCGIAGFAIRWQANFPCTLIQLCAEFTCWF